MILDVVQSFVLIEGYQPRPVEEEKKMSVKNFANIVGNVCSSIYRDEFRKCLESSEQMFLIWFFTKELEQGHGQFNGDIIEHLK